MTKNKTVIINGVQFRLGELDWEDATISVRASLPDFSRLRQGKEYIGRRKTSAGLIAHIGRYFVVISERDTVGEEYDFALVPTHAKTEIHYF
jgi:hypothetical protein